MYTSEVDRSKIDLPYWRYVRREKVMMNRKFKTRRQKYFGQKSDPMKVHGWGQLLKDQDSDVLKDPNYNGNKL